MKTGKNHLVKNIRRAGAVIMAALLYMGTMPVETAWALNIEKDGDNVGYAQDADGFVYCIPADATVKKGCSIYMYGGNKSVVTFPKTCDAYTVTDVGSSLSELIMTPFSSVTIPSGYTTIGSKAFQNQKELYQIVIPASVKNIAEDAFYGCNQDKLTIVTPYGSAAEKYAKEHHIHYTNSTALRIEAGGGRMYAGEKRQIAVLNYSGTVTWKSTDNKVAVVDKYGNVTAKKAGKVKITATIGKKTYTYPYAVLSRTKDHVLDIIWTEYVRADMSDYERAVAAQDWLEKNVSVTGTSASDKDAFEKGKVNDTGFCNAYKTILSYYGMKVKVTAGNSHKENTVVIAGKTYTASTLKKESPVDKNYTTTTIPGVSLNKSTMILSIGKKGTFIPSGNKKAVTWTSSSKTVAVVDKKGKVTAKKAGTAVITMKTDGKTYQCRVCVNNKA